jgi:regulator of sigma E protease
VGTAIDPLKLPDVLAALHGQEVTVVVQRDVKGADPKAIEKRLIPADKPGWIERPDAQDDPLSVPAIGVAFAVIPTVLKVDPGSPADQAGMVKGERIRKAALVPAENQPPDLWKTITVDFDAKEEDKEFAGRPLNWAYVFWMMQKAPTRNVVLTVSGEGQAREVTVTPRTDPRDDWCVPDERGLLLMPMSIPQKADSLADAVTLGLEHTESSITSIYLTLRRLLGRDLSYKELHGPLGIAKFAYSVAKQGFPELLLFLGFLSVNLAVLNFLPIPVLDGGHMIFLIWEGITRKRPSERVLIAATYFGMAFVLCLMMLVLYLDIFEHKIIGN